MPDSRRIPVRSIAARVFSIRVFWPIAAIIAIGLVNLVVQPRFFQLGLVDGRLSGMLVDIASNGAVIVLLSVGMTLVIATGGVDLSVGATMAIAGAAAAVLVGELHMNGYLAIAAGVGVGAVAGLWNGVLVAGAGVQPIVATLVLMVAGRGVAQLLTGGQHVSFDPGPLSGLDAATLLMVPMPIWIAALITLLAIGLARGTGLGLFIESVGDNERAARLAGVPVRRVRLLSYVIAGVCAGIAGLLAAADIRMADANNAGLYRELDAILAVVLGGTPLVGGRFSIIGAVLGALLIQMITATMLMSRIDPNAVLAVKAAAVLGVCLLLSARFRAGVRDRVRWALGLRRSRA